jgi:DNA-binding CsgD family transcriptional regulator
MAPGVAAQLVARGEDALEAGEWEAARASFAAAVDADDAPEAHDGLGLALWWLRDVDGGLAERERAYAAFRKRGDMSRAARIAMWIATEYLEAVGNEAASRGWFARAEGLVRDLDSGVERGWLAVTRGRLASRPASARADAGSAVSAAREAGDADLETTALALLGLALIDEGDVDGGMRSLDEAMAATTGGEVGNAQVFGDVCCLLTKAAEEAGDISHLMQWEQVVMSYLDRTGHAAFLEFCGTCCAELMVASGNLKEAEGWLERTLQELQGSGHRARCIHPAAKLAELRLLQGRKEEAARLLAGYEDRPDALRATARLHLANGETAVAAALLHRRLNQVGDGLLALPLLALLVEVQVAQHEPNEAHTSAEKMTAIAERSGQVRHLAPAALALGRAEAAAGDRSARAHLESAIDAFTRAEMPLDVATARLELAQLVLDDEPELAANEARLALEAADTAGAGMLADRAAALVRELGGPARTGPKLLGQLSKREVEVLRLLGEGLKNAEIAARLYISTKTAGNHVSNILAKLHLRSRSEAAAYAARNLDPERAPG